MRLPDLFVHFSPFAQILRKKIAFLAFDNEINQRNLIKLANIDFQHQHLFGVEVKDYSNQDLHKETIFLFDFKLGHRIPAKTSENVQSAFYLGNT